MSLEWGYLEDNGPLTWGEKFPAARGARQSPIDIDTTIASSDSQLFENPLSWTLPQDACLRVVNTGYGWRIDVDGSNSQLSGGPLSDSYRLEQFHCHWGPTSETGSEHTVNGQTYAGELHLVHWNSDKYSSFKEAAGMDDGLAVLGIFFDVGENEHPEITKILNLLPAIPFRGQISDVAEQVDPNLLLPDNPNRYWTYLGSLTTPPCSESVIWIVFQEPIIVTENQLNLFRTLKTVGEEENTDDDSTLLVSNFRPPMSLGSRVLRECGPV